jgi:hypothetical protein
MRGAMSLKILEAIEEGALAMPDLFCVLIEAGDGASLSKLRRVQGQLQKQREAQRRDDALSAQERQKYYNFTLLLEKSGVN